MGYTVAMARTPRDIVCVLPPKKRLRESASDAELCNRGAKVRPSDETRNPWEESDAPWSGTVPFTTGGFFDLKKEEAERKPLPERLWQLLGPSIDKIRYTDGSVYENNEPRYHYVGAQSPGNALKGFQVQKWKNKQHIRYGFTSTAKLGALLFAAAQADKRLTTQSRLYQWLTWMMVRGDEAVTQWLANDEVDINTLPNTSWIHGQGRKSKTTDSRPQPGVVRE